MLKSKGFYRGADFFLKVTTSEALSETCKAHKQSRAEVLLDCS